MKDLLENYFDYNATTPVLESVFDSVRTHFFTYGNPSSVHHQGRKAKNLIRHAREGLAKVIGVNPSEFIYTSGGSESNNTAITSAFYRLRQKKDFHNHFMLSPFEHPSVEKTMDFLKSNFSTKISYIPVTSDLQIEFTELEEILKNDPVDFASFIYADNETGILLPVERLVKLFKSFNIITHSDCVQVLGKYPYFTLNNLDLDFASFSAHKCYAFKGTGGLFVKKQSPYEALVHGGGQERGRRAGTENLLGILSWTYSMEFLSSSLEVDLKRIKGLRDVLERQVLKTIEGVDITGSSLPRLDNTSHMVIYGVDGETLLMNLDLAGFSVSTGAACSSGASEPSPKLQKLGLSREQAQSSLRLSLGRYNTEESINRFSEELLKSVERIRRVYT